MKFLRKRVNACSEMSSLYHGRKWGTSTTASVVPAVPPSSVPDFEFGARGGVFKLEQLPEDIELFEVDGMILTIPGHMMTSECDEETRERDHARPLPLPFLSPLHLCHSSQLEIIKQKPVKKSKHGGHKTRLKSALLGLLGISSIEYGNAKILSLLIPLPRRNMKPSSSRQHQPSATRMKSSPFPGLPPPMRKTCSGRATCTRVAPVMNIPSCCTPSETSFLFGLSRLSLWGKKKKCRE